MNYYIITYCVYFCGEYIFKEKLQIVYFGFLRIFFSGFLPLICFQFYLLPQSKLFMLATVAHLKHMCNHVNTMFEIPKMNIYHHYNIYFPFQGGC